MQPSLHARLCYTLHRGLFSSTAMGLLKLYVPEKQQIGEFDCGAKHQLFYPTMLYYTGVGGIAKLLSGTYKLAVF